MSTEMFLNIAQGIQSIVLSIGIIIGAFWALARLYLRKEITRSSLEVQKQSIELNKKKGFVRSINYELGDPNSKGTPLFITVNLTNKSYETFSLDFEKTPVCISKITPRKNGIHDFETIAWLQHLKAHHGNTGKSYTSSFTFLPETEYSFSFFYEVPTPGIYLITSIMKAPDRLADHLKMIDPDNPAHLKEQSPFIMTEKYIQIPNRTNL